MYFLRSLDLHDKIYLACFYSRTGAFQVCPGVLLHPSGSVGTFASNFGPGNTSTEFYGRLPMVDVL